MNIRVISDFRKFYYLLIDRQAFLQLMVIFSGKIERNPKYSQLHLHYLWIRELKRREVVEWVMFQEEAGNTDGIQGWTSKTRSIPIRNPHSFVLTEVSWRMKIGAEVTLSSEENSLEVITDMNNRRLTSIVLHLVRCERFYVTTSQDFYIYCTRIYRKVTEGAWFWVSQHWWDRSTRRSERSRCDH